jgi:hypothetical protein
MVDVARLILAPRNRSRGCVCNCLIVVCQHVNHFCNRGLGFVTFFLFACFFPQRSLVCYLEPSLKPLRPFVSAI